MAFDYKQTNTSVNDEPAGLVSFGCDTGSSPELNYRPRHGISVERTSSQGADSQ